MDQQLGQSLERKIGKSTYLSLLPRELRSLLYKYIFLESHYNIEVLLHEDIPPNQRIYDREARLTLYDDHIYLIYSFDLTYMKNETQNNGSIDKFINNILNMEPDRYALSINKYIDFIISLDFSGIEINYIIQGETDSVAFITAMTKIDITVDILEELQKIADVENIH